MIKLSTFIILQHWWDSDDQWELCPVANSAGKFVKFLKFKYQHFYNFLSPLAAVDHSGLKVWFDVENVGEACVLRLDYFLHCLVAWVDEKVLLLCGIVFIIARHYFRLFQITQQNNDQLKLEHIREIIFMLALSISTNPALILGNYAEDHENYLDINNSNQSHLLSDSRLQM